MTTGLSVTSAVLSAALFAVNCQCSSVEWWATQLNETKGLKKQPNPTVKGGDFTDWRNPIFEITEEAGSQAVYGFGGSLTESSAYLLKQLKNHNYGEYSTLINELFGTKGTLGDHSAAMRVLRLPITSTDFGTGSSYRDFWSFDDVAGDTDMNYVRLENAPAYLFEILEDIISVQSDISIMLCPWSAPVWLKTGTSSSYGGWGSGSLPKSNANTYAKYLWTVVELMKTEKQINVDYLALQNEPLHSNINYPAMSMGVDSAVDLSIALYNERANSDLEYYLKGIDVVIFDHNWINVSYPIQVMDKLKEQNYNAYQMVSGAAFHCYKGDMEDQRQFQNAYKDKELYFTECTGHGTSDWKSNIDWNTYTLYHGSVVNYGSTMVLHWNIVLNENHQPYNGGYCDDCRGIITLNSRDYSVTYNEEYYGVAHYGKFISNDGSTKVVNYDEKGSPGCGQGIDGFLNIAVFMNKKENAMIINVNNLCKDYETRTVIIQRKGHYTKEYVEIQAVSGLNTLRWK